MKIEDIMSISAEECEARLAEIKTEMVAEDADIEALSAEVDAINERRNSLIEAEEQRKALADKMTVDNAVAIIEERKEDTKMADIEVRNTQEYINAYAEYLKTEDDSECRSLITENVSGSVAVPDMVYDIVKTAWEKDGIMSRVKKTYIQGNLKVQFEASADPAVVHVEGSGAVTEEDLTLGIVTLVPASIKKWISVSDEALDLRGEAFLRYIYDELTHQIAKKTADSIITAIIACPATSTSTAVGVPTVSAAALAMGTIAEALGQLSDEASNPVVIMNKATWSAFKAVQYANGFNADPFEGCEVIYNNSLKSFASASATDTVVIVGDLAVGALANFPNGEGINIKVDDKTKMEEDLVRILGRQYVGLGIVAPNAFVKVVKA